MIDEAKILEILKDAFGALDDALGDSDFPVETDEEEREYHPTQYAARRVSEVIQILEPARAAELLRADGTPAIELLERIRDKVLRDENYDADEIVREIDAVLKTAGVR